LARFKLPVSSIFLQKDGLQGSVGVRDLVLFPEGVASVDDGPSDDGFLAIGLPFSPSKLLIT